MARRATTCCPSVTWLNSQILNAMPEKVCSAKKRTQKKLQHELQKETELLLESTVKICRVFAAARRRTRRFDEPALGETSWGGERVDSEREMPKCVDKEVSQYFHVRNLGWKAQSVLCFVSIHACVRINVSSLIYILHFSMTFFSLLCLVNLPAIHLLSFNTKYSAFTCLLLWLQLQRMIRSEHWKWTE